MSEDYVDFDDRDLHKGRFDTVLPGYYVGQLVTIKDDEKENKVCGFKIVSANKGKEAEVGKVHGEWIPTNSKSGNVKKRIALALALGLINADDLRAAKEHGTPLRYDFAAGLGRCVCLEISEEEGDDGKPRYRVPFWNYFHPDSKEARRFPVDHKAIAAAAAGFEQEGLSVDPWEAEGRGVANEPQKQPPQANATDDFDPFA